MKKILLNFISGLYSKCKNIYFNQSYLEYKNRYDIHENFKFNGENIRLYGNGKIKIGENSYIGWNSTIQSYDGYKVVIGRNCNISHNVRIYSASNNPDQNFDSGKVKIKIYGDVIIGNGVWIGVNVFINPGVTIGDNSVIGANAVVTRDVLKNSIVGGVPAKLIRNKDV